LGSSSQNVEVVIISSGGRPRARATIVRVVATPIILRLWRHLLVVFALHALDACRPSNGRRDLLSFNGVARCNSSGRDTPSATDALVSTLSSSGTQWLLRECKILLERVDSRAPNSAK
jgi:hypothetical protein